MSRQFFRVNFRSFIQDNEFHGLEDTNFQKWIRTFWCACKRIKENQSKEEIRTGLCVHGDSYFVNCRITFYLCVACSSSNENNIVDHIM